MGMYEIYILNETFIQAYYTTVYANLNVIHDRIDQFKVHNMEI